MKADKTKENNTMIEDHLRDWTKDMAPALLVLLLSAIFSILIVNLTFAKGWLGIYGLFSRFFRFALFLCLPLYLLRYFYNFVVSRMRGKLLQVDVQGVGNINHLNHWVFRPFQGIGIELLFGTNLLTILLVVIGQEAASSLLPHGWFQFERFLATAGITIFISLLLSTLWTLDDMGIRYFNRKDQEIKMVGKYAGTLMPIISGFYGILGLFTNYPFMEALVYLLKIIVILYPPFTIFAVIHSYVLRGNAESLLERHSIMKGSI
jgi:hypothetical protein